MGGVTGAAFGSILGALSQVLHTHLFTSYSHLHQYPHFTAEITEAKPRLTVRLNLAVLGCTTARQ